MAPKVNDLSAGVVNIVVKCKKTSINVVDITSPNYSMIDISKNDGLWIR